MDENKEFELKKILELIENKRIADLRKYLDKVKSADFPSIFEELTEEQEIIIYRLLSKKKAAKVFIELDSDEQEKLIAYLTDSEIKNVMNEIYMDDAVDLIEEMPANVVKKILANTKPEDRKTINELLKYEDDTAGSLMTTEVIDLKETMTVGRAFETIRKKGVQRETVYNCYILSKKRELLGVIDIKELLIQERDVLLKDIMDTNVISVNTQEDQEEVVKLFDKYDLVAVPVVDNENKLVGVITIDDAIDAMNEETLEDFEKMAAITPNEDTYFKTSVITHAKNRVLWLFLLMFSATISGRIMNHFSNAVAAIPLLVAFVPMLMDTGGNSGSQAATLIIRGLAVDDISTKDILRVMWKEARVAFLVGIFLGVLNGIRVAIQYNNVPLACVVGLSIFAVVLAAKELGCILPIVAKKLHLDPAIMAAPLITTLVDSFSITIYFTLAIAILNI